MKTTLICLSLFTAALGGCVSMGTTNGTYGYAPQKQPDIHQWEQNCNRQSFPQCGQGS